MKTQELILLYQSFYKNPKKNQKLIDNLLYGIFNYSFDDVERLIYTNELINDNIFPPFYFLKSNTKKLYSFHPKGIIGKIEWHLRFQHRHSKILFVWDQLWPREISLEDDAVVGGDWYQKNFRENVIQKLEERMCIYGYAHTLNQISQDQEFLDICNIKKCNFFNSDVPCFVNKNNFMKRQIHLNDQMIDWKSGINFYTCTNNQKHFLPLFSIRKNHYKNLLNLTDYKSSKDDFIKINPKPIKCECGKIRCEFEFIPHYKNFIDGFNYEDCLDFANKISSQIRWFQIIQINKKMHVFYENNQNHNLLDVDAEKIDIMFNKPKYIRGQKFRVGSKIPAFWKITDASGLSFL
jgi:hypothetical protein